MQTIAGAISTATHGTGARLRNISAQVDAARARARRRLDARLLGGADPSAFLAARVGVGSLGVIAAVTLRCVPAFTLRGVDRPAPLERDARRASSELGERERPLRVLRLPALRHGADAHEQPRRGAAAGRTQGALRYVFQTSQPSWLINDSGNSAGFGPMTDAVYNGVIGGTGLAAATSLELTTAWNVNAAYEHFWSPRWRTSLYGGYAQVSYSGTAKSILCGFGTSGVVTNGCDGDWQTWWLGSRTQWNVTKDFYMGLDVMYSKLQSATAAVSPTLGCLGGHRRNLGVSCRRPTRTTGRSGSACTATSIPDRVIMDV